jgi:hypothetical protein
MKTEENTNKKQGYVTVKIDLVSASYIKDLLTGKEYIETVTTVNGGDEHTCRKEIEPLLPNTEEVEE